MRRGQDNGPRQQRAPASGTTKARVSQSMKAAQKKKRQQGVNLGAFANFTRNGQAVHSEASSSKSNVPVPPTVPPPTAPPVQQLGDAPAHVPAVSPAAPPAPAVAPAPLAMEENEGVAMEEDEGARGAIDNRDVQADFDDPDPDDNGPRTGGDKDDDEATPGPMRTYLKAVYARIKEELGDKFTGEQWLIERLKEHSWWLRAEFAEKVCEKLEIPYGEPAYYRNIHVWLPDLRWGVEAMPVCGQCCQPATRAYGFQPNHYGRKIIAWDTHYFIITRRYYCGCCHKRAKELTATINVSTTTHLSPPPHACNYPPPLPALTSASPHPSHPCRAPPSRMNPSTTRSWAMTRKADRSSHTITGSSFLRSSPTAPDSIIS